MLGILRKAFLDLLLIKHLVASLCKEKEAQYPSTMSCQSDFY